MVLDLMMVRLRVCASDTEKFMHALVKHAASL
jgi:hypothetical protein